MQIIYLDVLLCINLFINYFLLLATAKLLSCEIKRLRLLLGAFAGTVFSLSIFLPEMGVLVIPIRLLMSGAITLCSFGFKSKALFLKQIATFFFINFLFAGMMFLLLTAFPKCGGRVSNSVVYMNVSPIMLIFSTLICYTTVRVISRFSRTGLTFEQSEALITVEVFEKSITVRALCDTGSLIEEAFSGYPVIIADLKVIEGLIPTDVMPFFEKGEAVCDYNWNKILRVVPCETLSGESFLKCFRPKSVTIKYNNKISVLKKVYIGVSQKQIAGGEFDAIINPKIIENPGKKISLRERKAL